MMEIQPNKRYELKMTFDNLHRYRAEAWVKTNRFAFHTAYPTRVVNNIYFDSSGLDALNDHLSGVETRRKLRFRWYGEQVDQIHGQLEVKHKEGDTGWKWTEIVEAPLRLNNMTWDEIHSILLSNCDAKIAVLLQSARPVLINQYRRDYYVSADGNIRITLDYDLNTYQQRFSGKPNIQFNDPYKNTVVIEFKCDIEHAKQMADVLAQFPLRVNAYSKYLNGMRL